MIQLRRNDADENEAALREWFRRDGSYDEEAVDAWLRTRNRALRWRKPIRVLRYRGDLEHVLGAAWTTVGVHGIKEGESFFDDWDTRPRPQPREPGNRRRSVRRENDER